MTEPVRLTIESPFTIGDRCIVDGDSSLIATVTALQWRLQALDVELSWVAHGSAQSSWFQHWRLSLAGEA